MIFVLYVLVAAGVCFVSVKASNYVDVLDQKTKLSGAFLGGILLSAVTSLPELFTSITAAVFVGQPEMCLGNILGSDLFNLAALSFFILVFHRDFSHAKLSAGHRMVTILTFGCYLAVTADLLYTKPQALPISLTSIVIIVLYALSVRFLSGDDNESRSQPDTCPLSLKQVLFRLALASVCIVVLSVIITYITDDITVLLHLNQGVAGALFLGIATSLPEVASTIALFRMKSYDIAFGNIIGSCIFNFIILSVVDILYSGGSVYVFGDVQTTVLLLCGMAALPLIYILMRWRSRITQLVCSLGILVCYAVFLLS